MADSDKPMSRARILPAIIAGSGLYEPAGWKATGADTVSTPWGEPSEPIKRGVFKDTEVLFLPRHGRDHRLPPHRINYRANIAALAACGATHVLAFNVVGGINPALPAGRLLVPDQIIDYTWGRGHTFSDAANQKLQHVDFTWPYDAALRKTLLSTGKRQDVDIHNGGVYGATQGPRLESAAEIARLEHDGCDIVGMTGMPEAGLAREQGLPYACLALVVNPAAGKSEAPIGLSDIERVLSEKLPLVNALLLDCCRQIGA